MRFCHIFLVDNFLALVYNKVVLDQKTNGSLRIKPFFLFFNLICPHGVMDSTTVFGTVSSGSSPDGDAKKQRKTLRCFYFFAKIEKFAKLCLQSQKFMI